MGYEEMTAMNQVHTGWKGSWLDRKKNFGVKYITPKLGGLCWRRFLTRVKINAGMEKVSDGVEEAADLEGSNIYDAEIGKGWQELYRSVEKLDFFRFQ